MTFINQAIVVVGLALGLLLAYRAWLIRAELQDLDSFVANGDRLVQIADEGWAGGFGSVNLICRQGKAHHVLVSWRMPCHSEPNACNYPAAVDRTWPTSGTTSDGNQATNDATPNAVVRFEAANSDETLQDVGLSNMSIAKREHGEVLVSKQLSETTSKSLRNRIAASTARFTINIGRQSEWFYLNSLADTPERFATVCSRP